MPSPSPSGVLLSWVDLRTDPYARGREPDTPEPGPTLTLLFDSESPYRQRIGRVVLFYRKPAHEPRGHEDQATAEATKKEIERLSQRYPIQVDLRPWHGEDPTDHRGLFDFLDPNIQAIRDEHPDDELVIHISPGTPAMQTVWVLMAEMGLVRTPFTVVKSLRRAFRAGRPAVVPVRLDIPTFYKAFQTAKPRQVASVEESIFLDPRHFISDDLKQLYTRARRFAQLNVPILIVGERGTGKTTLASWIRSNSPFRQPEKDSSWPSVPCSQYSPETMRAELFGYMKGAFTDAKQDTEGLLHVADEDTLFLDEIGDISRDLQRLLIRALEEKQFTRVGARTPEQTNFRLLSATNLPWPELKGRLDPDFLDRISVLVLEMPPLRRLRDDLPWLWDHVFRQALRRSKIAPERLNLDERHHRQVIAHLQRHPLPGNLRDLFRVAYHLIASHFDDGTSPPPPTDVAVDEALTLALAQREGTGGPTLPRAIASAFSQGEPLDGLLPNGDQLPTKEVERALRRYMAEEIRRIARVKGTRPQTLCDVTDRTLQEWIKL